MFGIMWFLATCCSALGIATPVDCRATAGTSPQVMVLTADGATGAGGRVIKLDCAKAGAATWQDSASAGDGSDGAPTWVTVSATAGEDGKLIVTSEDSGAAPRAWLGVRLTAVPAPLAAHIGEGGVMIANVVKGSPADAAGLQQYDVVVELQGKAVAQAQDLTAAMSEIQPGELCTLGLVRKAQRQSCQVTLAERPTELSMDFKYAEPDFSMASDAIKTYAKALKLGEDGKWVMEDLGPLYHLPEDLGDIWSSALGSTSGPLKLFIQKHLDSEDGEAAGDEGAERRMEWTIEVRKNDENITIRRAGDGQIHVTKVGADGQETSADYASADELQEKDPEVYKLYSGCHIGQPADVIRLRPFGPRAETLRRSFQIDVDKTIEEALAQARAECDRANEQVDKASELVKEAMKNVRVKVRHGDKGDATKSNTIVVTSTDKGLKVVVVRDGNKQEYTFADKEELQKLNPELYEEVKDCLP